MDAPGKRELLDLLGRHAQQARLRELLALEQAPQRGIAPKPEERRLTQS